MRFEPPSIAWRGKLANLRAQVHQQKPEHGEKAGSLKCICGANLRFVIASNGVSRGSCNAACGARWVN